MATPTIDNLVLRSGRCLVRPDQGSKTTGVIVQTSAQGFKPLIQVPANGADPNSPPVPAVLFTHVLFVKDGAVEVEVDGVKYLAMSQNNVIGLIPDE